MPAVQEPTGLMGFEPRLEPCINTTPSVPETSDPTSSTTSPRVMLPDKATATDPSYSHLLSLPLELKREIIQYLVHGPEPSIAILRRVQTHFRDIIPKGKGRAQLSKEDARAQLLKAESYVFDFHYCPQLTPLKLRLFLPDNFYPCYECINVLPDHKFGDNMRNKKKYGSERAHTRICLECGMKTGLYMPGQRIRVTHVLRIVCEGCGLKVVYHAARQMYCEDCSP